MGVQVPFRAQTDRIARSQFPVLKVKVCCSAGTCQTQVPSQLGHPSLCPAGDEENWSVSKCEREATPTRVGPGPGGRRCGSSCACAQCSGETGVGRENMAASIFYSRLLAGTTLRSHRPQAALRAAAQVGCLRPGPLWPRWVGRREKGQERRFRFGGRDVGRQPRAASRDPVTPETRECAMACRRPGTGSVPCKCEQDCVGRCLFRLLGQESRLYLAAQALEYLGVAGVGGSEDRCGGPQECFCALPSGEA